MKLNPLNQQIKVKLSKPFSDSLLSQNNFLSKKDIGPLITELINSDENIAEKIDAFVKRKYGVDEIINMLESSGNQKVTFQQVRESLKMTKRAFYPRLRIIRKCYDNSPAFPWKVKRGYFEKQTKRKKPILYQNKIYETKIAETQSEKDEVYRLRYDVFHTELNELPKNEEQMDKDEFDKLCDHLILKQKKTGKIIGTYRILPWFNLEKGYYSETEFTFDNMPKQNCAELGRLCIAKEFRDSNCFITLWLGLYKYAKRNKIHHVFGVTSLRKNTSDEKMRDIYLYLKNNNMISDTFMATPFEPVPKLEAGKKIDKKTFSKMVPKMVLNYSRVGTFFVGEPSYDPIFKVYDLLTIYDMRTLRIKSATSLWTVENHLKTIFSES